MDLLTIVVLMGILVFVGVTIYIANQEQAEGKPWKISRFLVYVMIVTMGMLAPSAYFLTTAPDYTGAPSDLWIAVGLVAVGVVLSYAAVTSVEFRGLLQRLIGGGGDFDADSNVHATAFVLMTALFLWNTVPFVMQGGIEGYARALEQNGVSIGEPVINAALQITVALLGVGLYIRRTLPQTLDRLGLRLPTREDITTGLGAGMLLLGVSFGFSIVWAALAPEDATQQSSASNQIAMSFASLPLAFLLASCAALGEEIFIRGALQPVFGIVGSSIFFALLHAQYLITPGLLVIFVVSLVLGVLRARLSTNAAIVAHFIFDFIPLALLAAGTMQ
ncbi:MAG: CPBP family intramembrane glutamic endopeptidase [Anaerolineae bacterium]